MMTNLACYYKNIENYELALKYFFMNVNYKDKVIECINKINNPKKQFFHLLKLEMTREEINLYLDEHFNPEFAQYHILKLSKSNLKKLNKKHKSCCHCC